MKRSLLRTWASVLSLAFGLALVLPRSARAEDYQGTITAAIEEYRQGNWAEALALFHHAHALQPSARTFRGLGVASFEMRRYADSVAFLQASLGDDRKALTPSQRQEVEALLGRAMTFVTRARIQVEPVEAVVTIDGNVVTNGNRGDLLVDAGTHQIIARAPGYETATRTVEWLPGARIDYAIELEPSGSKSAGQQATDSPPAFARPSDSTRLGVPKYLLLGLTGGAAVLTGVSVALRQDHARTLRREDCAAYVSRNADDCKRWYDNGEAWKRTAIISGALGGALLVSTVVLFALDGPREHKVARLLRACALGSSAITCRAQF